jgi:hypothetical protein
VVTHAAVQQLSVRRLPSDEATDAPFELLIGQWIGGEAWATQGLSRTRILPEDLRRFAEAASSLLSEYDRDLALLRDHADPTIALMARVRAGLQALDQEPVPIKLPGLTPRALLPSGATRQEEGASEGPVAPALAPKQPRPWWARVARPLRSTGTHRAGAQPSTSPGRSSAA